MNLPWHTVGKVNNMFRSMPILRCSRTLLPNSMAPAWATGTAVADVLRQRAIEEHRFLFHETNLGTQPSWQSCNWGMTAWQEKVSESISVAGAAWVHAWSNEISNGHKKYILSWSQAGQMPGKMPWTHDRAAESVAPLHYRLGISRSIWIWMELDCVNNLHSPSWRLRVTVILKGLSQATQIQSPVIHTVK